MTADPWFWAIAVFAVLFAGVSKGGFGSGASFAAAPLLALVIEPRLALGLMLPLLMVMDVAALRAYWGKWSRPDVLRLCLGAVPGILLAIWFQSRADPDTLRLLIGAISIGFVAFQLARGRGWIRARAAPLGAAAGALAGLTGGFTSYVSHAGGPPVLIYLLSQRLAKTQFQATTVAVFFVVNLLKIGPYVAMGFIPGEALLPVALLVPVALLGIRVGVWAHARLDPTLYFTVTYALLLGTGSKLILDALT
jgi:uncharacterized membrane protein YfcA